MKLLALDTATEACSAALLLQETISERYEVIGRGHAERLLPMADGLLREAGIEIQGLDAIAFGRGPGGFTGLRIAAATAQGLAAGAGLPVLPVSDLAALAVAGARASGSSRVLACMDARMGQVYWAAYEVTGDEAAARSPESLSAPASLALPAGGPWFGAGHGFAAWPELAPRLGGALAGVDATLLPRAGDIARLAARGLRSGQALPASRAQPLYLRDEVVHKR
ncbi:MAG TPA: tRNA (adenosine(37)-N6)-threonylcarbamoyltransferase complex dimerization subunit type 1 TsaB [Steroidobacteraceae bacterium]|nr:tRNA (adenosine(37)-N6)-threonylcarbamoyltransferase complex dimerization subunit type 1 TsaB [Steroidobacteraceae bacterium]